MRVRLGGSGIAGATMLAGCAIAAVQVQSLFGARTVDESPTIQLKGLVDAYTAVRLAMRLPTTLPKPTLSRTTFSVPAGNLTTVSSGWPVTACSSSQPRVRS